MTSSKNTRVLTEIADLRDSCDRFLEALSRAQSNRKLQQITKELEKAYRDAFRQQGKLFVNGLDSVSHTYPQMEARRLSQFSEWWWEYIGWWVYLGRAMRDTIRDFVTATDLAATAAYFLGGDILIGEVGIGLSFNLANPRAVAFLEDYGADLVMKINETTREYINSVLVRGREQGWGYDKVAKAITSRYEEFAVGRPQQHIRSRAHLIANNEIGNAYEEGNLEAARQMDEAGLTVEKYWANVGDDRVSEGCLANTAAGWILLDQPFPSGHMRPLRHPACRCHAEYRRRKVAA